MNESYIVSDSEIQYLKSYDNKLQIFNLFSTNSNKFDVSLFNERYGNVRF